MATLSRRKLAQRAANRLQAGDSKASVLKELAAYLLDTKRTKESELIVRDIESMLASGGIVVGTAVSARKLSMESLQTIEDVVRQQYGANSQVVLRERIDESLIGGVRLELPGRQLDASVKAKLEKLTV